MFEQRVSPRAHNIRYCNRAACYLKLKKPKRAVEEATSALETDCKHGKSLFRRARAFEMQNMEKSALEDVLTLLDFDATNKSALKMQRLLTKKMHPRCVSV